MPRAFVENPDQVTTIFFDFKFGGKWKLSLLCLLYDEPLTFGKIRTYVPSISSKVLTKNLNELIDEKMVLKKTVVKESKTIYQLSPKGKSLYPIIESIHFWTLKNYPDKSFIEH
ncbi:helix-turn-helix domain-containing protein [Winogradskyella sp.]|uniref:winged helix-turn-helix transcriptional regulator n=1 Tax=Winogradskyella sp. TaxID=1883156 RepID=UPI002637E9F5|nr:helix-turn-helix domain-containing protein [Winogradskyella sp.]